MAVSAARVLQGGVQEHGMEPHASGLADSPRAECGSMGGSQHLFFVISWSQYFYLFLRSIYVRSIINKNTCANGETNNSVVLCMNVNDLLLSALPLIVYCS